MASEDTSIDRRTVLRAAGATLGGGLLASGSGTAATCWRTSFYTPAYEEGGKHYCIGQQIMQIPPDVEGQIYDSCGEYVYFLPNSSSDSEYYGWVEEDGLVPCY